MSDILTPRFARLTDYFGLWLAEPMAARHLWESARGWDLSAHVAASAQTVLRPLAAQTVQAANGKTVAVIPITGVLMKGRSSLGGTSTIDVRRAVRNAANDPAVSAILLAIDSPGGTVAGVEELAAEVKRAAVKKPLWAQADDLLASAAYWVASQASRIYANANTALIGSVGTFVTVYDTSGAAEKEGVKVLHFATGALKGAGTPGTEVTPEQAAYFRGIVDGIQEEFDRAVREGRRMSAEQLSAVRTGAVWKAAEAMALGLIDGVQPAEATIDQLSRSAGAIPTLNRGVSLPVLRHLAREQGDPA